MVDWKVVLPYGYVTTFTTAFVDQVAVGDLVVMGETLNLVTQSRAYLPNPEVMWLLSYRNLLTDVEHGQFLKRDTYISQLAQFVIHESPHPNDDPNSVTTCDPDHASPRTQTR